MARVSVVALCLSLFAAARAQATPIVVATVTPVGLQFRYDYSLDFDADPEADPDTDPAALVTINVLPNDASLVILGAPLGYSILYSSSGPFGFLDLFPVVNVNFPTTGTLGVFSIRSARGPARTTFDGFTASGVLFSGPTTGPLAPVPEPATLALLAMGLGALGGRRVLTRRGRSR